MIISLFKSLLTFVLISTLATVATAQEPDAKDLKNWKKASQLIVSNKEKQAKRILLELARGSSLQKDLIYLTLGRLTFQNNDFMESIRYYQQVEADSPYWLEAKEELSWVYIRLNKPDKAISQIATVMSPVFLGQVGPEPYFLTAYANLMICDYAKIFSITESFKKNEKDKVSELEKLSKGAESEVLNKAFEKLKKSDFLPSTIAKELPLLPRNILRDEDFQAQWSSFKTWQTQLQPLEEKLEDNPNDVSTKSKVQDLQKRMNIALARASRRAQLMARSDLKEYNTIIHKLHLVEAEVIQRIHLKESKIGQRSQISQSVAKSSEVLTFPDTKEVWVDELDNYHLDAKDCPKIMQVNL